MVEAHAKQYKEQMDRDERQRDAALEPMDAVKRRAIMRTVDGETSNWLTVVPFSRDHFDLSAVQICDALAVRPLLRMPADCDDYWAPFDLGHVLDCKKGGLVT